jgi:hypothetical protein
VISHWRSSIGRSGVFEKASGVRRHDYAGIKSTDDAAVPVGASTLRFTQTFSRSFLPCGALLGVFRQRISVDQYASFTCHH